MEHLEVIERVRRFEWSTSDITHIFGANLKINLKKKWSQWGVNDLTGVMYRCVYNAGCCVVCPKSLSVNSSSLPNVFRTFFQKIP